MSNLNHLSPERRLELAKGHLTPTADCPVSLYNIEAAESLLASLGKTWIDIGFSNDVITNLRSEAYKTTALNMIRTLQKGVARSTGPDTWAYSPVSEKDRVRIIKDLEELMVKGGLTGWMSL